jgi:hypothetical protein
VSDSPDVLAEIEEALQEHGLRNEFLPHMCGGCGNQPFGACQTHRALTGWKKAEIANRQRRSEAEDALRGLTPGGSEFQTPEECVAFVRADRESARRAMLAFKLRADKAEEEKRALAEALRVLAESTPWDNLEAWYPAMSPTEREALDVVREALLAVKESA